MANGDDPKKFVLSREIRLGDVLTVVGVFVMLIAKDQRTDFRIDLVERAQAAQVETNKELRTNIRETNDTVSGALREQGTAIRRIEDKLNRARL